MLFLAAGVATTLAASAMKTLVHVTPFTIPPRATQKTVVIDVRAVRAELLATANNRKQELTLELDVEAQRPPEVFFEVSLSTPGGKHYNVGNVALYGAGIRGEGRGEFHPAHVQLLIGAAVTASLSVSNANTLQLTFATRGAEGVAPPRSKAAVRVARAEIVAGPRLRE
jgi:hypothetical protein